jgi:amidophosphoribosyltransferase
VSVKLNALRHNVAGKRIVLIDDSIVRGTTMRRLVGMLRRAGATEVHIRIASPPVQHACYFGMDYPSRNELAGRRGVEEVREMIGADSLGYLSLPGLHASLGNTGQYCMGCLTGVYPVAAPVGQEKDEIPEAIAARDAAAAAAGSGAGGESARDTADYADAAASSGAAAGSGAGAGAGRRRS